MNSTELKTILDLHAKWIRKEPDGKRANLYMADLFFITRQEAVNY